MYWNGLPSSWFLMLALYADFNKRTPGSHLWIQKSWEIEHYVLHLSLFPLMQLFFTALMLIHGSSNNKEY
jgi:hypothetical protein